MLNILGLQKLTLLDYPGNMACTVFLGGCNFRCPFCHNRALVVNPDFSAAMAKDDFFSFLKKRSGVLDGVCITGGEPLLSSGIFDFAKEIKDMGFKIKLDTNGSFPDRMVKLIDDGLIDYVAMDIKNSQARYRETVGVESFDLAPVKESVSLLLSDLVPYEFRTTLVREFHTPQDMVEIGEWLSGAKQYFLQTFVDSGCLIGENLNPLSGDETKALADILRPFIPSVSLRGID